MMNLRDILILLGLITTATAAVTSIVTQQQSEPLSGEVQPQTTFTCTRVIGFSQTRQWFADVPDFESLVDNSKWELLWKAGANIELWKNPDFSGWSQPIVSACQTQSGDPDRVVLTISGSSRAQTDWEADISGVIPVIRQKYPNVQSILLQPVVGGPNHQVCYVGADDVRASVNHPVIDAAIANIVGGDVAAGSSSEVADCAQYSDGQGHLTSNGQQHAGNWLGSYYQNLDSGTPPPPPSPPPSPSPSPSSSPSPSPSPGSSPSTPPSSSPSSGSSGSTTTATPPPPPGAPQITKVVLLGQEYILPLEVLQVEKGNDVTLVGTAKAGETVTVYVLSEEKKFDVVADGSGTWTFDVWTKNLAEGEHQVDLETASAGRYKALAFSVVPVGFGTVVEEAPPPVPTAAETPSTKKFPWLPVSAAFSGLLTTGGLAYYFLRRRKLKILDETPAV